MSTSSFFLSNPLETIPKANVQTILLFLDKSGQQVLCLHVHVFPFLGLKNSDLGLALCLHWLWQRRCVPSSPFLQNVKGHYSIVFLPHTLPCLISSRQYIQCTYSLNYCHPTPSLTTVIQLIVKVKLWFHYFIIR